MTTDETTSHSAAPPKNDGQAAGYPRGGAIDGGRGFVATLSCILENSIVGCYAKLINCILKTLWENGMKKIILSVARTKVFCLLVGIMAAVTFASEVSAQPLFARQTGMACSACHFQHFPMLNGFGRAFKSAGYTMMGAQEKVEGEGLAIPNTLNITVLTTAGYEKTNQAAGIGPKKTTGDGAFYVPGTGGELSLFFGGRVSENAGFLAELGMGGPAAAATAARGSAKLPILFEVAAPQFKVAEGTRAGVVPFTTDAEGASYGFEVLNTGANAVHQMSGMPGLNGAHSAALSAQQYIGTAGSATGLALVANNPMGFINLTKYDQTGIARGTLAVLGSTYIRVAGIFDLAGWDAGAGIQIWRGNSAVAGASTYADTRATAIDGQMQGALGNMPVGFYASYATAPAGTNTYNMDPAAAVPPTGSTIYGTATTVTTIYGTATKSAFNISAEVGVIPEKVTLGAAIRFGKSGVKVGTASNASDNAIMLIATYKLAQNMMASFSLTSASGEYWNAAHQNALGSGTTTINLFTLL
jgi:hypothetical protein